MAGNQTRLFLCSQVQDAALAMQAAVFQRSGRTVVKTALPRDVAKDLRDGSFDVLVMNHTVSFAERNIIAKQAKQARPEIGVLVLHASGGLGNPYVDIAVDSRSGPQAMLQGLRRVEALLTVRKHKHDGVGRESDCLVIVDRDRHYIYASEGACHLLGYELAMFLELRIDDVVAGAKPVAEHLFEQFVTAGTQAGEIVLKHRSGRLLPVRYAARAEADGCLIARWDPIAEERT